MLEVLVIILLGTHADITNLVACVLKSTFLFHVYMTFKQSGLQWTSNTTLLA